MRYYNLRLIICSIMLLVMSSCSSDEVPIEYLGVYESISLTYTACDDPADEGDVWRADSYGEFCTQDGDKEECFSLTVSVQRYGETLH